MLDARQSIVQRFFEGTGSTYDFMVNFGTFGFDRSWKREILDQIPPTPKRLLDLACGTGIVTLSVADRFPQCHVIGCDMTLEYLTIARKKLARAHRPNVEFIHQRAEETSFEDLFDCVTASYLAKYADLEKLTRNVKGLLNNKGIFIMHDFSYPSNSLAASLWEFYFKLQQTIGIRFYPQWKTIYHELPVLLRKTTWIKDLTDSLKRHDFRNITVKNLTFGGAAIVTAQK